MHGGELPSHYGGSDCEENSRFWIRDFRGRARTRTASFDGARFGIPNVGRVFRNSAIAGKLARCGDIENGLSCPCVGITIERVQALVRV